MYRAPKGIAGHPGVAECDDGIAGGSDYKHDVLLREGWTFRNGRMSGCRVGFFHSVADFVHAGAQREPRERPLGPEQRRTLEWLRSRGGSVVAPAGDSVLRALVRKGLVRDLGAARPSDRDVAAFGKEPGWQPRQGTWKRFEAATKD